MIRERVPCCEDTAIHQLPIAVSIFIILYHSTDNIEVKQEHGAQIFLPDPALNSFGGVCVCIQKIYIYSENTYIQKKMYIYSENTYIQKNIYIFRNGIAGSSGSSF